MIEVRVQPPPHQTESPVLPPLSGSQPHETFRMIGNYRVYSASDAPTAKDVDLARFRLTVQFGKEGKRRYAMIPQRFVEP